MPFVCPPTTEMHQPIQNKEIEAALVRCAIEGRKNAYCPYSNYAVGAALLTRNGEIINGCNVENAAYGSTICAERTAIGNAIVRGHREFVAIAIITKDGKGYPCGSCRQYLNEFAPNAVVIIADPSGQIHDRRLLSELLPCAFGPHNL